MTEQTEQKAVDQMPAYSEAVKSGLYAKKNRPGGEI